MKTRPLLASLLVASLAVPPQAFAQAPPAPVQPVPYAPSQPVPYPGATDSPPAVNVPRAGAQPIGPDTVYLKGGGLIRGTLIEAIPNDHATVAMATGQSAVIPWDRVERIDRGGGASAPRSSPGAASTASLGPEPTAFVHIEADAPVVLERREGRPWVLACSAPCDAELPLSGLYRIGGSGVRNTSPFHLSARAGDHVVLDVSTASKGSFIGGIVLTGSGALVMLIGAMVLFTVATVDTANQAQGFSAPNGDASANTVGWVMVAGGAAATVVGVILLASSTHSKVEQTPAGQRPRSDAWLRAPTWHEDRSGMAAPRVVGMPLFQTTF